jgi:hypothetical protein
LETAGEAGTEGEGVVRGGAALASAGLAVWLIGEDVTVAGDCGAADAKEPVAAGLVATGLVEGEADVAAGGVCAGFSTAVAAVAAGLVATGVAVVEGVGVVRGGATGVSAGLAGAV